VAESVLTGESQPVDKTVDGLDDADLPLGDRTNMLHMNTCPRACVSGDRNRHEHRDRCDRNASGRGWWSQDTTAAPHRSTLVRVRPQEGHVSGDHSRIAQTLTQLLTIVALAVVPVVFLLTAVSLAVATIPGEPDRCRRLHPGDRCVEAGAPIQTSPSL
jgi:P-type Ca2+ transporter type 2C